jgi:hypothetical protein
MFFCPDDGLDVKKSGWVGIQKSYWIGFWEDYNRFLLPEEQPVPDTGLVIPYTMRRVIWELDWLLENEPIDARRVSLMGGSMGGRGANYLSRAYPEKFAAWLSLCPGIKPPDGDPFTGTAEQNLTTSFPGNPGIMQAMDLRTRLSAIERDIPFGKVVGGRADQTLAALSPDMIQAYRNLDDAGFGSHIYWDDRGHVYTEGSYWSGSFRHTAQALTAYRSDQSFPAFFHDDQDFQSAGQQPDLGTGEPDSGDEWGTWGGYYRWDSGSIVDTDTLWKASIYLISDGESPVDIPDFDSSRADIAIRRPQHFLPPDSGSISWELVRLADSRIMQSGWGKVENEGLVIIPDVTIYKEKCELRVGLIPTSATSMEFRQMVLQVYPNPVSLAVTIDFGLQQAGRVSLTIHNLAGQLVDILLDKYYPSGKFSEKWDASDYPPGIYICSLKTKRELIHRKIIVSH